MTSKHLTEEALLGLAGKRLPDNALRAVEKHLAECAACRQEYDEFQFAHSVVARMAEIGYQEALGVPAENSGAPVQSQKKHCHKEFEFPWGPVLGTTVGCICVLAFLFYPRFIPAASAAELLSNAMRYEERAGDAKAFRVQVSGQTCAGGQTSEKMVSFDSSVRCSRALQHIQNTPWGHGNPLSARTYANWRSSLHRRHDRVTKHEKSWELQTIADEGAVHAANLDLRASDYHATQLTLDFTDNEEVSISEETKPLQPIAPAPLAADISTRTDKPMTQLVDDPVDLTEVQAWNALHQLNADSGWEATVLRDGQNVQVKAIVRDDARKAEFESKFAAYRGIVLDIRFSANPGSVSDVFPDRIHNSGDSPALAAEWLKQQFPDPDKRAGFSNDVMRTSQEILGRAFIVSKMKQRQIALEHCSCAKELAALVETERRSLGSMENSLSTSLDPLFGAPLSASSRTLTLSEARDLDASLRELLWRSSDAYSTTFDTSVDQVRKLLARN